MLNKATTHAYLKGKLALPDYYGEKLGSYVECIISLLEQAAEENEYIQVDIERDNGI